MSPSTTPLRPVPVDLAALVERVDREGIDTIEPAVLRSVARRARLDGLHPELASALVDAATPAVVRARIVGHIHRLAHRPPTPTPTSLPRPSPAANAA